MKVDFLMGALAQKQEGMEVEVRPLMHGPSGKS